MGAAACSEGCAHLFRGTRPPLIADGAKDDSAWPKTLILVRHGESTYNVHYEATQTDSMNFWDAPLTQRGEEQARAIRAELASIKPAVQLAMTSPLSRAMRTCLLALPLTAGGLSSRCRYEVTPLIAEHLEASCDLGRSPKDLAKDFPELDFGALDEVWWYVPEEHRMGITPERSRQLFRDTGALEPSAALAQRADNFAAEVARRKENAIAVFAHADFLHEVLRRHFARAEDRFSDYWMRNCEVLKLSVSAPADLLSPQAPSPAPPIPEPEIEEEKPPPVLPPKAPSAASIGLAALKRKLSADFPDRKPSEITKMAALQWKSMDAAQRTSYMGAAAE
eukprot:gnl/TRDRNA2_/TRDRNA2_41727_c0_seq1.p1 gnl/TRDRNA2_/TRDRNA2_41727_c0~~gnl/TRDRNA2_/TRDRNA2_41727_c0_seq1.p1  ORF type:complete len:349 (-),score=73.42 gnl/TRDRNA2_/TRDRNA2_41727_c0_seq1:94-1104(-)